MKSSQRRLGGKLQGFTLIELLVVVAIIALLAALLLPSLKQARAKARASLCQSNLKQITLAMVMYADDYRGFFPYAAITSPNQYTFPDLLHTAGLLRGTTDKTKNSAYICPDFDRAIYVSNYSGYIVTYASNLGIVGEYQSFNWTVPAIPINRIPNPSGTVLIGDGVYQMAPAHVYLNLADGVLIGKYYPNGGIWGPAIKYAHNIAPQAACVDGHVEARKDWSGSGLAMGN